MSFDSIKGQDDAVARLQSALRNGKLAHAVLLAGPEGVGKRMAAIEVARALLCKTGPKTACGTCPSCHRVERETHADLYLAEPPAGGAAVRIDQIRDLSMRLAESPLEGLRKVAIIDAADTMTPQAQNAFLKTLEEPPMDTTIILIAENTETLLPTVRSRCRRVNFKPVEDSVIAAFLAENGAPKETAEVLARVAAGSFSRAAALVEGQAAEVRRSFLGRMTSTEELDEDGLTGYIAGGGKSVAGKPKPPLKDRREGAIDLLAILHSFLVDCLRIKSGAAAGTNLDLEREARSFAAARQFEELADLEKEVADGIIVLGRNADLRLVAGRIVSAFAAGHA